MIFTKIFAIILINILCSTLMAVEFSTFNCDYLSQDEGKNWKMMMASESPHVHDLERYQTVFISKMLVTGKGGKQFGNCSYVDSNPPDSLRLKILFIEGEGLALESEHCGFSGTSKTVGRNFKDVVSSRGYLSSSHNVVLGGISLTFLHIVGLKGEDWPNPGLRCDEIFLKNEHGNLVGESENFKKNLVKVEFKHVRFPR